MNSERETVLKQLQQKCDEEKEAAIKKAKLEEQNAAEGRMNHFKDLFEKQVNICPTASVVLVIIKEKSLSFLIHGLCKLWNIFLLSCLLSEC